LRVVKLLDFESKKNKCKIFSFLLSKRQLFQLEWGYREKRNGISPPKKRKFITFLDLLPLPLPVSPLSGPEPSLLSSSSQQAKPPVDQAIFFQFLPIDDQ